MVGHTLYTCATQHIDPQLDPTVELGHPTENLAIEYHEIGQEVNHARSMHQRHLCGIQPTLHSIYWRKTEAELVEAGHLICMAVREAPKIGPHRTSGLRDLPKFEQGMR